MKITIALIDKLILLRNGESLPASRLKGEWVEDLVRDGVLISTSHGSRRTLFAPNVETLCKALASVDERFIDIELLRETLLSENALRSPQASSTGNSKLVMARSCLGFPINSYEPIPCTLNGREFVVNPQEGCFLFVTDWQLFFVPNDVVVVGIENMENFRMIRQQRELFEQCIGNNRLLFVSRYPQSTDLRSWLQIIPNRYIHFGDFDLAGINIFLTEYNVYLGDRSSLLIPSDIERRLATGTIGRYNDQYQKYKGIKSNIPEIQHLIDIINRYHRCYDQEGYIKIKEQCSSTKNS